MASQDSPSSDTGASGDKSKKYDRQLRLWGDHGQAALESAKVCLINATATGTEILKNLILPGVGSFTIVDGNKITEEDIGNNFFLDKDSVGKPRAQVATELLLELNEDVQGDFVEDGVEELLEHNTSFFTSFSVIVATSVSERTLLRLASLLWEHDIPLFICKSYGLIGYVRLAVKEHTVVESHPDSAIEDLRLDKPFPTLVSYCDTMNLDAMTKKEHMHVPWLVIIYKYLQRWKNEHGGEGPQNYREKNQLKALIGEGILRNEDNVPEDEENWDEAIRNVNTALVLTRICSELQAIFDDDKCCILNQESKPFWILARAVKEFVDNEGLGVLPLRGSIPDMTADSERYIALQNVYREQAEQDRSVVTNYVYHLLQAIGQEDLLNIETRSQHSPPRKRRRFMSNPSDEAQDGITEHDIKTFCKNASFLRMIRTSSVEEEYSPNTSKMPDQAYQLEDDDSDVVHYVMLRAVDKFFMEYNRYPGNFQDTIEADIPKLKSCVSKLIQEWGLQSQIKDDFILEYCRWGASELHTVAAYMGGTVAQEVIKVITHQFVPVNNTFIYNAMKQTSTTIQL